jgi:hypothetical protein
MTSHRPELTQEPLDLPVTRYRADGVPTCAANFNTADVCVFYGTRGMCGKNEFCSWTGTDLNRQTLENGKPGFLVPASQCPLWYPAVKP